jgi:hypothetical protein
MSDAFCYGPWSVSGEERLLQLRTLAGIVACHVGSREPVVRELRAAEADEARMGEALRLFEALPALVRRRILATHAAVTWPKGPSPAKPEVAAELVTRTV